MRRAKATAIARTACAADAHRQLWIAASLGMAALAAGAFGLL